MGDAAAFGENPIAAILTARQVEPDWLVPDLLLQGTIVCFAGEPGTGKSYVSYTLALALASGSPALGGLIRPGPPRRVVYFDEENSTQDRDEYLRRSWHGLARQNKCEPDIDLLMENFWPVQFHLGIVDWQDRMAEWVDFVRPHLIVVDTATPALHIEDENNNAEASRAIKGLRAIAGLVAPPATVLVLRHAKTRERGGRRTMRGATVWSGQTDATWFQVRARGRPRRDGLALTRLEPDKIRAYGLRQVIYITPAWTDTDRSGLTLVGSYRASVAHREAEKGEEADEDEP